VRFVLVDRITELEPGKSVAAEKTLSPQEELFEDHFPGFPVVPGVLLVEMMAQAAGKCLDAEQRSRGRAMLAQIRSASFREWVRPGETAEIRATVQRSQDSIATVRCRVQVAGRDACSAELLFAFVPRDRFAVDWRDPVMEEFLDTHGPKAPQEPQKR